MSNRHFSFKKFGHSGKKPYICTKYKLMIMQKRLLMTLFAGLLLGATPLATAAADMELAAVGQAEPQVTITVSQSKVLISGAQGETLEVVSLTGKLLMTVKIDSPAQRVELNVPKGCYILKVGKVVRKVSVR